MKAVIYARYSCDNQREESIEGQLRECKVFAERKGYTLVGTYIDRAMSAKTDNRPEFQRMIKESAKELFDVVIVWKLDRFARNRYDSAHYKATLRRNGVKVVSATEVISEGAEGIILESVLEGYAEYYSAELSEKVIRGMTENALKCQYNGGYIPMGYKVDEHKHYQIDELTAPFVKEAFLMYVNGQHIKKIVEYLNENGVRSSRNKPVTKTTVATILQNRKYIGEYHYRDVLIPDGIPAIISKELFALAQQRMEQNKYAPSASRSEIKYLLTGKLMCGDCGSVYAGESGTGRTGQKYHYYKCVKAKKRDGCERKAIKKEDVEEAVIEATLKNIFIDEVIEEIADRVISWQGKESTLVPLYQRELADVEKSISNLLLAIEQGIITSATKNRMAELETLKTDLEEKIAREEIQTQILTKEQVKFWLKNMEKLDLASTDNRQRIINTFVNSIYVFEDRFEVNFNCREGFEKIPLDNERFVSPIEISGEAKYLIGEPLYRMEQHFKMQGIYLNRTSLANWIIKSSEWLIPIVKHFWKYAYLEPVLNADETTLRVLKIHGKPVKKLGQMWVVCTGASAKLLIAIYTYRDSRSKVTAEELLGSYDGIVQTDGLGAYGSGEYLHAGCWSHARRKFLDSIPENDKNSKAAKAVGIIDRAFALEREARKANYSPEKILEMRQKEVRPIIEEFYSFIGTLRPSKGSHLGAAVTYALNQKDKLLLFLDHPEVEMTNNLAERTVKPFVIDRKNFLFSATDKGADASALFMSVIETAKRNGLNVFGYLSYLMLVLPSWGKTPSEEQLDSIMPWSAALPETCHRTYHQIVENMAEVK